MVGGGYGAAGLDVKSGDQEVGGQAGKSACGRESRSKRDWVGKFEGRGRAGRSAPRRHKQTSEGLEQGSGRGHVQCPEMEVIVNSLIPGELQVFLLVMLSIDLG